MARIDELLAKDQTELTADEIQEIVDYRVAVGLQEAEAQIARNLRIAESEARLSMERKEIERTQAAMDEVLAMARKRFEEASNGS